MGLRKTGLSTNLLADDVKKAPGAPVGAGPPAGAFVAPALTASDAGIDERPGTKALLVVTNHFPPCSQPPAPGGGPSPPHQQPGGAFIHLVTYAVTGLAVQGDTAVTVVWFFESVAGKNLASDKPGTHSRGLSNGWRAFLSFVGVGGQWGDRRRPGVFDIALAASLAPVTPLILVHSTFVSAPAIVASLAGVVTAITTTHVAIGEGL